MSPSKVALITGSGKRRVGNAVALALAGHKVTALDPSEAMLAIARQKAEDAGVEVDFIAGNVTDLALEPGRYGFVVVPADVFLYCDGGEEQVATLHLLSESLAFNGVLAVDLPDPASWLDPSTNGQPLLVHTGQTENGEQLDTWQLNEDDLALQTRTLRVTYERTGRDGLVRRSMSEHQLCYVYRFEMEYLLHLAGMALLDVYGDYDLGALSNESERMILIARRKDA